GEFMNIYTLHRSVSRALSRANRITRRRTSATRERHESTDTSTRSWTIPLASKEILDSHAAAIRRRRLLLARGGQIHTRSVECADRCAIAILDTQGIVIAWHDHLPRARRSDHGVVNRHMSQFYLPEDIALYLPARHLSMAAEHGIDTQRGWRR